MTAATGNGGITIAKGGGAKPRSFSKQAVAEKTLNTELYHSDITAASQSPQNTQQKHHATFDAANRTLIPQSPTPAAENLSSFHNDNQQRMTGNAQQRSKSNSFVMPNHRTPDLLQRGAVMYHHKGGGSGFVKHTSTGITKNGNSSILGHQANMLIKASGRKTVMNDHTSLLNKNGAKPAMINGTNGPPTNSTAAVGEPTTNVINVLKAVKNSSSSLQNAGRQVSERSRRRLSQTSVNNIAAPSSEMTGTFRESSRGG